MFLVFYLYENIVLINDEHGMICPVGSADAGEKMCMLLNNILYLWKRTT